MRHRTSLPPALALLGTWTLASPAAAQRGYYLGGSWGGTDFRDACTGFEATDAGDRCDPTDEAWKLFGGYRFDRSWSVELSWIDLGAARVELAADAAGGKLSAEGLAAAAVGTLPLGEHFGLFAKAGVFAWRSDLSVHGLPFALSSTSSGEDFYYGGGVSLLLGEHLSLRAEWERFQGVGNGDTTGSSDADLLSAGLAVHF